jgi:hypothetical protein
MSPHHVVTALFGAMSLPSPEAGEGDHPAAGSWDNSEDSNASAADNTHSTIRSDDSDGMQGSAHVAVMYGDTGMVMGGRSEVEYDDELAYLLQRNTLESDESPMDMSFSYIS